MPTTPAVLIVEDDAANRRLLVEHVKLTGHRAIARAGPLEALSALERDPSIGLVLTDVRMPSAQDGIAFIRTIRARRPDLPLAAVTGYPDDLVELFGTSSCPVLVLTKPVRREQVAEVVRLAMPGSQPGTKHPTTLARVSLASASRSGSAEETREPH